MKTEQSPYRLIATDQSHSLFWLTFLNPKVIFFWKSRFGNLWKNFLLIFEDLHLDSALYLLILWFRLFMFSYLTSFFSLRMLPGEVNLSLHRKGLSKIKLSKIIIKKNHKFVFNMDDCFYSFGGWWKKTKRKEKKKQCVMFVANSVWEETRSRIV